MKLIKPSYQILPQDNYNIDYVYKSIELAGRTCYSPDTEVLTDSGWKRIENLLETDKVVSYNPNNNTIIYDYPNLVMEDYDDDMIEITHPNIKMKVTKDHRIYQSVPDKRNYTFLKAAQLAGIEKINHSKQCRFRIPKYFNRVKRDVNINIPSIVYSKEIKNGYRESSTTTITIPCNIDFMVIAGAFISEGYTFHGEKYRSGSYCQITQDENSELYSKVIEALNNLKWKYRIDSDPRKPNIKQIIFGTNQCWILAFDDLFGKGSSNKHLPIWFRTLPDEFLKVLISTMYLGDGSHNITRNERYLSISERLLNEIQEVFILLGINGTVHYDQYVNQMCYFEESHRDSWIISRDKHIKLVPYKGKVYCTSTKSGIICIRYKGKVCWCGNCYKSEDKITDDSAKEFVNRMIKLNHGAMLEHGTIYLNIDDPSYIMECIKKYTSNKYSKVYKNTLERDWDYPHLYVTTNLRVLVENGWMDDLKYLCEPTKYHEKRVGVKFNTSIGISRELIRQRAMSFSEQSTRYCNYTKNKFNNSISFSIPHWIDLPEGFYDLWDGDWVFKEYKDSLPRTLCIPSDNSDTDNFLNSCSMSEILYFSLINKGKKPQDARNVLPLSTHTELIVTGFVSDWKHVFDLRDSKAAHPDMQVLMKPLHEEFIEKGYIQ